MLRGRYLALSGLRLPVAARMTWFSSAEISIYASSQLARRGIFALTGHLVHLRHLGHRDIVV